MPEILEIINYDKAMYELNERLKTEQEFSESFFAELEELKQISISVSED